MGKRGPKPKPTPILKLVGSRRCSQRKGEVQPAGGKPYQPRGLDQEGLRVWKKIVPKLFAAGLATPIDGEQLERYCHLRSLYRKTREFLAARRDDFYVVRNDVGVVIGIRELPHVKRLLLIGAQLARIEASFGMTPSARAGMAIASNTITKVNDSDQAKANLLRLG